MRVDALITSFKQIGAEYSTHTAKMQSYSRRFKYPLHIIAN